MTIDAMQPERMNVLKGRGRSRMVVLVGCAILLVTPPAPAAGRETLFAAAQPDPAAYPALPNLMRLTETVYSGGEPAEEDAFASLARLGIKTIVSVDGARPDVEAARRHGLRYVHIPIGYDGIPRHAALSIANAMQADIGPYYFHCHHGLHRGPAAAACVAAGITDGPGALAILEKAGTSANYTGLWRDVAAFHTPLPGIPLPPLREVADVDSFAAAMARVDRAWDNLKLCGEANWRPPVDHPDLVPAQEVLMLREGLREAARHVSPAHGAAFRDWLADAERLAADVEEALRAGDDASVPGRVETLAASCLQCHQRYRN